MSVIKSVVGHRRSFVGRSRKMKPYSGKLSAPISFRYGGSKYNIRLPYPILAEIQQDMEEFDLSFSDVMRAIIDLRSRMTIEGDSILWKLAASRDSIH
jgi:hypothetical protein